MRKLLAFVISFLLWSSCALAQTQTLVITSCPATVPSTWNSGSNTIHLIGGGAGGIDSTTAGGGQNGPGGGGGLWGSATNVTLTPSATLNCQIGAAGTHGSLAGATSGGDTVVNGTHTTVGTCSGSELCAQGGQKATVQGGAGGAGGSTFFGVTSHNAGGAGGTSSSFA